MRIIKINAGGTDAVLMLPNTGEFVTMLVDDTAQVARLCDRLEKHVGVRGFRRTEMGTGRIVIDAQRLTAPNQQALMDVCADAMCKVYGQPVEVRVSMDRTAARVES